MTKQQTVTRSDYDVQGFSISRVAKVWWVWKRFPYGIAGQGPSLKELVILWGQHRFGQYWIRRKNNQNKT